MGAVKLDLQVLLADDVTSNNMCRIRIVVLTMTLQHAVYYFWF
jgi:hypothetical protein